jgi:hypothetical protein
MVLQVNEKMIYQIKERVELKWGSTLFIVLSHEILCVLVLRNL